MQNSTAASQIHAAAATVMATTGSAVEAADTKVNLQPERLLQRVRSLERQLKEANEELIKAKAALGSKGATGATSSTNGRPSSPEGSRRPYDPSKYSTRFIALKLAYLGQGFHGFEHHTNNSTPQTTIEEELWRALVKSRLVWPSGDGGIETVDWTGLDYSKCGRTDKGVSAFGQVIALRVRSNRPLPVTVSIASTGSPEQATQNSSAGSVDDASQGGIGIDMPLAEISQDDTGSETISDFDDLRDELPYPKLLNQILPPEIRILAWCPSTPDDFSARFSCRERQYRYFFTQPAFNPTPGPAGLAAGLTKDSQGDKRRDGWLDIAAMQQAAQRYLGLHDFRNFCKVDASKQIENFMRRIFVSEIREVDPVSEPAAYVAARGFAETKSSKTLSLQQHDGSSTCSSRPPKVYQFVLHGSAFLWHQVRHMVAILFLVGQGLEQPEVVDELLDVQRMPGRPVYEMADDAPLVLWDCIFPEGGQDAVAGPHGFEDAMPWVWADDHRLVVDEIWQSWRRHKIDEILAGSLLNLAVELSQRQTPRSEPQEQQEQQQLMRRKGNPRQWVFLGGNAARPRGNYVPLAQLKKNDPVELINERYRKRKGIKVSATSGGVGAGAGAGASTTTTTIGDGDE